MTTAVTPMSSASSSHGFSVFSCPLMPMTGMSVVFTDGVGVGVAVQMGPPAGCDGAVLSGFEGGNGKETLDDVLVVGFTDGCVVSPGTAVGVGVMDGNAVG